MSPRSILALSILPWLAACGSSTPATDRYVPFSDDNVSAVATQQAKLEMLAEQLEAKDFAAIESAYQTSFQSDLKALVASHAYVSGGTTLGAALDQQVLAAIALGKGTSEVVVKEAAEEQIRTIVYRYSFESLYGQLAAGSELGWDRAFAYFGRSSDGVKSDGLAGIAAERDTEFGTKKNDAVFAALIAGRNALAAGDQPTMKDQAQKIDLAITEIFGLSAHHEFSEAAENVEMGMLLDAVEGFAVGSGFMAILHDYIASKGGAATNAAIAAELEKGNASDTATMNMVKFTTVVSSIDSFFGFTF